MIKCQLLQLMDKDLENNHTFLFENLRAALSDRDDLPTSQKPMQYKEHRHFHQNILFSLFPSAEK